MEHLKNWKGKKVGKGVYTYCCPKASIGAGFVLIATIGAKLYIVFGRHKQKERENLCFFGGHTETFVPNSDEAEKKKSDMDFEAVVPSTLLTAIREAKEETGLNIKLNKQKTPFRVLINNKPYDISKICSQSSQLVDGQNQVMVGEGYLLNLGKFNNIALFQKEFSLKVGDDIGQIYFVPLSNITYNKQEKLPPNMKSFKPDVGKTTVSVKPEFCLDLNNNIIEVKNVLQHYVDWIKINALNNAVAEYYAQTIEDIQNIKDKTPQCEGVSNGGLNRFETILTQLKNYYQPQLSNKCNNTNYIWSSVQKLLDGDRHYDGSLMCLTQKFRAGFKTLVDNLTNKKKMIETKRQRRFSF